MFIIRKEQLERLRRASINKFAQDMLRHVRSVFQKETELLTDEGLLRQIRRGIDDSMLSEITKEGNVQRYLECECFLDWKLKSKPWAYKILQRQDVDEDQKMDWIVLRCFGVGQDWNQQ